MNNKNNLVIFENTELQIMTLEKKIKAKIKELEEIREGFLKEYQEKLQNGEDDEALWRYIGNKNIEIYTLKNILK